MPFVTLSNIYYRYILALEAIRKVRKEQVSFSLQNCLGIHSSQYKVQRMFYVSRFSNENKNTLRDNITSLTQYCQ